MAKFGILRSIGHNVADSVGSGVGLLVGVYSMDIYGEAAASPEGYIEINFLTGKTSGSKVSESLGDAIKLYKEGLPRLCTRHGIDVAEFRQLTARYSGQGVLRGFCVTTENSQGRTLIDEYRGMPGKRLKVMDPFGRIRPKNGTGSR